MDLKQLEYIMEIAKEKNITHAAEKIFISQSALNQQLLKLEKELGAKLFYRHRNSWELTEIGKIYLENVEKILKIKKETYDRIEDLLEEKKVKLKVGIPQGRWIELFIYIYKKLKEKYPKIQIEPFELSVQELQKKISIGEIDIGIVSLEKNQQTKDKYLILYEEELVLIKVKNFEREKNIKNSVNLFSFKDKEFIFPTKTSTSREIIDKIFKLENINPKIIFETHSMESLVTAVISGIGYGIVPYYYAEKYKEKLKIYKLKSEPIWDIAVSYSKDIYVSKVIKDFIKYAQEFLENFKKSDI